MFSYMPKPEVFSNDSINGPSTTEPLFFCKPFQGTFTLSLKTQTLNPLHGSCEDPAPRAHYFSRACAEKHTKTYALRVFSGWPWPHHLNPKP